MVRGVVDLFGVCYKGGDFAVHDQAAEPALRKRHFLGWNFST